MKKTENKKTKVKGKKRPFFTISKKILALSLLPMIIVCALVATVGSRALEAGIEKQIEKALQIVGVSVDETYTNLYEGDYTKDKGGKVRKGGTSISGETQLIDGLQEKTGFQVSFLYGNMRLITTLTKKMAEDLTEYMREIGIRVKWKRRSTSRSRRENRCSLRIATSLKWITMYIINR